MCTHSFFPFFSNFHLPISASTKLEKDPSKSRDSPPEKAVVKERIPEKFDFSKGISRKKGPAVGNVHSVHINI